MTTRELGRLELWLFDRKCRRRFIHARGWSCLDWHMRTCWRCNLRRCRKSAPRERWERAQRLKAATTNAPVKVIAAGKDQA